jgi:DNA polymerase III subunit epsilon
VAPLRLIDDPEFRTTGLLVVDFETVTPKGYPPEPIEVAIQALRVDDDQLAPAGQWSALMRPPPHAPLTAFDEHQTGITAGMLVGQPDAATVLGRLDRRFDAPPYLLVAHHAPTEAGVFYLYREVCPLLARIDLLDTVRLARLAYPELTSHSLDALISHLGLPWPAHRHRAGADVLTTITVLERLLATGRWSSLRELRRDGLYLAKAAQPFQPGLF